MNYDPFLEDRVNAASGIELVRILYRAALDEITRARRALNAGDIPMRSHALGKASGLIGELAQSLVETPESAALVNQLRLLYDYTLSLLAKANFEQVEAPLVEAERLLATMLEGWMAIEEPAPQSAEAAQAASFSLHG